MTEQANRDASWGANLWAALRDYFGSLGRRRNEPLRDRAALQRFVNTRASFVAQTSLYGYLRTRAGMIYPQLFDDDEFARAINIAKWHIWLACLSDLAIFAGGTLQREAQAPTANVGSVMQQITDAILDETGIPSDADAQFAAHAGQVRARLAACDWSQIADDETAFSESPSALVHYAPVVKNLKELDAEIVRNSVRFRWQEVRRDLRRDLDAQAVMHDTVPS